MELEKNAPPGLPFPSYPLACALLNAPANWLARAVELAKQCWNSNVARLSVSTEIAALNGARDVGSVRIDYIFVDPPAPVTVWKRKRFGATHQRCAVAQVTVTLTQFW